MLTPIIWNNLLHSEKINLLQRPRSKNMGDVTASVQAIIQQVQLHGDLACYQMTKQFDGVDLDCLAVSPNELLTAQQQVRAATRLAILRVIDQLHAFHAPQLLKDIKVETSPGIFCERQSRPIQRVGLYIPGGNAPLISTVLMLGVPAKIANCPLRIMCTPPRGDGTIDPNILVAAECCGIEKIYKLGGAQAIAAMAYGTQTIPKVDKLFGPGNSWVTQAKMLVAQDATGALYDLPAGPSEVMVIADSSAKPEFIAADLLSQAEHGSDSQVMLLCTVPQLADQVRYALERQLSALTKHSLAAQALQNSALIIVDSVFTAIDIANEYAPEHLILQIDTPRRYLSNIQNAGSIFLGLWSPEAAGDYASGTNHVLPTYGFAKSLSGLAVNDFMKSITIQELTREGLIDIADTIAELARMEGLTAHKHAIDIRLAGEKNAK